MSALPIPTVLPDDQRSRDTQRASVVGQPRRPAQTHSDSHLVIGGADPSADPTSDSTTPKDDVSGPQPSQPDPTAASMPTSHAGLADTLLLIYADALDDIERTRIANENRVRSLRDVKGMDGTPEEARLQGMVDALAALEHGCELELKRALRKHPLGPWVKRTVGVGEKQGARLIAAIGNPADRRTVSQLWAYCGYHVLHPSQVAPHAHTSGAGVDPSSGISHVTCEPHIYVAGVAPSRKRGQQANWNSTAKMRAFLVAESCIKHRHSPYRKVYDDGRAKYADSLHSTECKRCGPSGKPAIAGSPLSDGHKHARAMRLVAKAILRDLWVEAKAVTA